MRACVLTPEGLTVASTPDPQPTSNHVVVAVRTAGLNRRDHWITVGKYPGVLLPVVLGSDACGVVDTPGHALDGQRVVIDPSMSWDADFDTQGDDYQILGMPLQGTLAERISVPASNVYAAPDHCSDAEAAALPLAGVTAWRATMKRAGVQRGEHVLVTGIGGGVATFAAQIAKAAGCKVWVTSSKSANIERAIDMLGVDGGALYSDADWAKQIAKQSGHIDAVIDGAGGAGINDCLGLVRPGGRIAIYGATAGAVPNMNLHRLFWKQITIAGSTMGSPRDMADWLAFASAHRLQPVVDSVYELDNVADAFARLATSEQFGNIVVRVAE
jgi:zinc-binding alcohol dehydrogenase/oxidoreductase